MDTLDPHALDESVKARLAGQRRLNIMRLEHTRTCGSVALRVAGGSGTTTIGAHGIGEDLMAEACAAFNDVLISGGDRTERRRAKNQPIAEALDRRAAQEMEQHL